MKQKTKIFNGAKVYMIYVDQVENQIRKLKSFLIIKILEHQSSFSFINVQTQRNPKSKWFV